MSSALIFNHRAYMIHQRNSENLGRTSLIPLILVAVVVAVIAIGAVYWIGQQEEQLLSSNTGTQQDKKTDGAGQSTGGVTLATIEGSLSYPSEFIPEDMQVCAQDIGTGTKKLYCTSEHIRDRRFGNGVGYRLQVPQGAYYVYATTKVLEGYKAYYSEFVTCGLKATCPSHEPIGIKVTAGKTITGIDPADWYKI